MILTAIAIFAIVGAALAFKAEKAYLGVIYTGPDGQHCTNRVVAATICPSGPPTVFVSTTKTTSCIKTCLIIDQ